MSPGFSSTLSQSDPNFWRGWPNLSILEMSSRVVGPLVGVASLVKNRLVASIALNGHWSTLPNMSNLLCLLPICPFPLRIFLNGPGGSVYGPQMGQVEQNPLMS